MPLTPRASKLIKIVILSSLTLWLTIKLGEGIAEGKLRRIYPALLFSILFMLPYTVRKIGLFPIFAGLIFVYWIPFRLRLEHFNPALVRMAPTELGCWLLLIGLMIHGVVSKGVQNRFGIGRLYGVPLILFVVGVLCTFMISESYWGKFAELAQIRTTCFLPIVICLLCIFLIRTAKQAERLLWVFLISSAFLGLVYLFAPQVVSWSTLQALGSRLTGSRPMKIIELPLRVFFESFEMNPETTPVCFSLVAVLSFTMWLSHPSSGGRLAGFIIMAISVAVVIVGQGRTGTVAMICGVIVVTVLLKKRMTHRFALTRMKLLRMVIIVTLALVGFRFYASISKHKEIQERGIIFSEIHLRALGNRADKWKDAISVIVDQPFGVGLFGFPGSVSGDSWYAHNLYLYVLLYSGFIGLIGFLLFFFRLIRRCRSAVGSKNPIRRLLCIGGLGLTTALLVGGIPSNIYFHPWEVLMVWIPVGITVAVSTLKDEDSGDNKQKIEARVR